MIDAGDAARGRMARKPSAPHRRVPQSSPARSRWWPISISIAGALTLGASFLIALELTRPAKPPSPAVLSLAGSVISDWRTLMAAIKAAGLTGSQTVKGAIDAIARQDERRVSITGWAGEVGHGETPLHVLVFVDGANTLRMRTAGQPADVAGAFGVADAATAQNVSFRGSVACARGQRLLIVAVADSGNYGYFSPRSCP